MPLPLKSDADRQYLGSFLIVLVNAAILLFGGYHQAGTWVLLIIYFTTIHATLVLLGVVGLSKALAGKHFHYPLIGAHCNSEAAS